MPKAKPNTFQAGLNMDVDPRMQPPGTYRDANNIKIVGLEGNTFSVENYKGQTERIDTGLADGNIVGYCSFADKIVLIHVNGITASTSTTKIFMFTKNDDDTFSSETDSNGAATHLYSAALNMTETQPVKVVGSYENKSTRRIYWTDNINPVRSMNLELLVYDLESYPITINQLPVNNLELLPSVRPQSPYLSGVIGGSLRVGTYQYCAKYVTQDGAETAALPLSGLYHTTANTGSYKNFMGSPQGVDSAMGFTLKLDNVDSSFERVKLFAIFYEQLNGTQKVYLVSDRITDGSSSLTFTHSRNESDNEVSINEILEPKNTFDIAKDLAIKDNILFAVNTRKRDAFVSADEFNPTLERWNNTLMEKKPTRYLQNGAYVRANQDINNYRFLPSSFSVNYSKNLSSSVPTTSNVMYEPKTNGWTLGTAVEETFATGVDFTDINITSSANYINAGGNDSVKHYESSDKFKYHWRIKVDTTGDGNYNKFYNSNGVWQDTSTTHVINGAEVGEGFANYQNGTGYMTSWDNIGLTITNVPTGVRKLFIELDEVNIITSDNIALNLVTSHTYSWYGNDIVITADELSSEGGYSYTIIETVNPSETNQVSDTSRVLGAMSPGYNSGAGVRLSFKTIPKVSDEVKSNPSEAPYIQTNDSITSVDISNVDAKVFSSTASSSNKDPQMLTLKGYKRGEIYRLGVLFYDKKGNPINTLWMGDVQMPEHGDRNLQLEKGVIKSTKGGTPVDIITTVASPPKINGNVCAEDYRLDVVDGIAVPGHVVLPNFATNGVSNYNLTNNNARNFLYPITDTDSASQRTFKHYTMDLAIVCEFRFPQSVLDKISGFQVVRAERSMQDASVMQSGLFREGAQFIFNDEGTANSLKNEAEGNIGGTNEANRILVNEKLEDFRAKFGVSEHIFYDEIAESNHEEPTSFIFGSSYSQNYSDTSAVRNRFWGVPNIGVVYSPDSLFGVYPYKFSSTDRIKTVSTISLKDNIQFQSTEAYTFGNSTPYEHRFYGFKVVNEADGQHKYFGKTYTVDTQFSILAEETFSNGDSAIKAYNNNTSFGSYFFDIQNDQNQPNYNPTGSRDANELFVRSILLDQAEEVFEGDTTRVNKYNRNFINMTYGNVRSAGLTPEGSPDDDATTYTSYFESYLVDSTSTNYWKVKSVQKGNKGIFVSPAGMPRIPNLNRLILGDGNLLWPNSYRHKKNPYMLLVDIVKSSSERESMYGGVSNDSLFSTRYIKAGEFTKVVIPGHTPDTNFKVNVHGGDVFTSIFSHQLTMSHYHPDGSAAKFITFPVESRVNPDMRSGFHLQAGKAEAGFFPDVIPNKNDLMYNPVYSQEPNFKGYISVDESKKAIDLDQPVQVAYSKSKVSGELEDSYRQFPIVQFHDLDNDAGEINSIVNFRDNLYCLQDSGFAKLFINSRALVGGAEGILIGSANTIENHSYISKQYGSIHREGVLSTDNALYFIDAKNSKIHRFTDRLESISDKGVMKFMNDTISSTSTFKSKKPNTTYSRIQDSQQHFASEARGVSIGYDQKEKRVIFTFSDRTGSNINKISIAYNEYMNAFESKLSATPPLWIMHQGNLYCHGRILPTMGNGNIACNKVSEFNVNESAYGMNANAVVLQDIEIIVNDGAVKNKKFDTVEVIGDTDINGTVTLSSADFSTDKTAQQTTNFAIDLIHTIREGVLSFPLRGKTAAKRLVGTYAKIKLKNNNNTKFSIFAIVAKIRQSLK